MGLNIYAEAVGGVGYTVATTTAAGGVVKIDGKPGKRLAITAYGFQDTGKVAVPDLYFMKPAQNTTIGTAAASNVTTITVTAFTTAPATSGNIVVVLDNGTYQWLTVASTASTTSVPVSSALTGAAAAGNPVYFLNVYSSAGHFRVQGSASGAQKTDSRDIGLFYDTPKGAPMMAHVIAAASTALCQIDYVSYAYINV
jgi:hypothetical protein